MGDRYLNAEHVAMIASFLWPHCGGDRNVQSVQKAIEIIEESNKRCNAINERRRLEEKDGR